MFSEASSCCSQLREQQTNSCSILHLRKGQRKSSEKEGWAHFCRQQNVVQIQEKKSIFWYLPDAIKSGERTVRLMGAYDVLKWFDQIFLEVPGGRRWRLWWFFCKWGCKVRGICWTWQHQEIRAGPRSSVTSKQTRREVHMHCKWMSELLHKTHTTSSIKNKMFCFRCSKKGMKLQFCIFILRVNTILNDYATYKRDKFVLQHNQINSKKPVICLPPLSVPLVNKYQISNL